MPWRLRWTEAALDDISVFDETLRRRIILKVNWFGMHRNPLRFAKRLTNTKAGSYRFRVGDYRILFDVEPSGVVAIFHILRVKHRRDMGIKANHEPKT